jgi:hypothetical protein
MIQCFYKVVIKKYFPLCMYTFAVTVGHERLSWGFTSSGLRGSKILKGIWKLLEEPVRPRQYPSEIVSPSESKPHAHTGGTMAYIGDTLIHSQKTSTGAIAWYY